MRIEVEVGDVLCGRFKLVSALGQGTTGRAFGAHDLVLEEDVVCKIPFNDDEESQNEFRAQYLKLRKIRSENFVQCLGFFTHEQDGGEFPVVVLEHIRGETLGDWASEKHEHEILPRIAEVASTLSQLHDNDITHGDLFEDNVMVNERGHAVLIDPESEVWGCSTPSARDGERRGDTGSFLQLMRQLLPRTLRGQLASLTSRLPRGAQDPSSLLETAQLLWGAARSPAFDFTASSNIAIAHGIEKRIGDASKTYSMVRRLRADAFRNLAAMIKETATAFKVTVTETCNWEDSEAESDAKQTGQLWDRYINCTSAIDARDQWALSLEPEMNFRKPWPQGEPNLLGVGRSQMTVRGGGRNVTIRIELVDGAAVVLAVPMLRANSQSTPALIDAKWIARNLCRLTDTPWTDPDDG